MKKLKHLKTFEETEYVYDTGIVCGNCEQEAEVNPDNGLCRDCDNDRDSYPDDVDCPDCDGEGYDDVTGEICDRCDGEGRVFRPDDIPPN